MRLLKGYVYHYQQNTCIQTSSCIGGDKFVVKYDIIKFCYIYSDSLVKLSTVSQTMCEECTT